MTFQERSTEFQKEVAGLQKKYGLQMYAAIVLAQNGEITPSIKLLDVSPAAVEMSIPITKKTK